MSVNAPGSEALRVLGGDAGRGAVGSPEDDGHRLQTGGHVVGLGGRVDDLVDGLHGEVEGHELTDGSQTGLGRSSRKLGSRRILSHQINCLNASRIQTSIISINLNLEFYAVDPFAAMDP